MIYEGVLTAQQLSKSMISTTSKGITPDNLKNKEKNTEDIRETAVQFVCIIAKKLLSVLL